MNTPEPIVPRPTELQIKLIVEVAVDRELPEFRMDADWYTEYDMDSMGAVALVVEVRSVFGVELPEDRMPDVRTGTSLCDLIMECRSKQVPEAA